jgi:putative membrane protein
LKQERTFLQKITLFLKGLAMGAANKVPGVSGGTVSFVLSFYEELIYSFQKVNLKALKLLISGRFKSFYQYTNAQFLILIMGGSIFSYFSISLVLDYFIKQYELYVWSWFFGMIIGSVFYIYKDFGDWNLKNSLSFVIGISIGVGISFMTPARENDNLWFVFFCGIIGVSGMTLPGLSGSFILILLGNYVLLLVDSVNGLLDVVTNLISGNFQVLDDPEKIRYLKIVSVFTAGSAFGLVSISHVLGYVLKRWHQIVTAVIIGFIAGSLGIVWPWKQEVFVRENGSFLLDKNNNKILENYKRFLPDMADSQTYFALLFILLGIVLILGIDYYGRKNRRQR